MVAGNQTTVETRAKYLVDEHIGEVAEVIGEPESWAKAKSRLFVKKEDELAWALSRDPASDMTLVEAHERAATYGYDRHVRESQSTISRRLREMDRLMLTRPIDRLHTYDFNDDESEFIESDRTAILDDPHYESLKKYTPDVLDMYRSVLARFLVDLRALEIFLDYAVVTPQWCRERFPDLHPDVGLRRHKREGFPEDEPTHLPDSEIDRVPESVHQS